MGLSGRVATGTGATPVVAPTHVVLARGAHPLARPEFDVGPLDPNKPRPPGPCMDLEHDWARGAYASPVLVDMDGDMVRELCADHTVAIFDGHAARAYGLDIVPWREDRGIAPLRAIMAGMQCGTPMVR